MRPDSATGNGDSVTVDGPPSLVLSRPVVGEAKAAAIGITPAVPWHAMSWLSVLAWLWGVGVALFALGRAYRIAGFWRLLRKASPPAPAVLNMAEEDRQAARPAASRREIVMLPVRLSPMVWSLGGRPRVVLPAELFERLERRPGRRFWPTSWPTCGERIIGFGCWNWR